MQLGYSLSSEEFDANTLVANAQRAEAAGFTFALISDHFHPWIDQQGESPFAWTVMGAIAGATRALRLGTGVTCPLLRYHPALIAQAAATVATMMPGRFFLGLGTGESLNEHILGQAWPAAVIRRAMLREAVAVIRQLWQGGTQSHYGEYYTVDRARVYSLPDELPPIYLAAAGEQGAQLAGEIGDGLVTTSPDPDLVAKYDTAGGRGKPKYGQLTVCWAKDEATARRVARRWWPMAAMKGELSQELPLPAYFEQATQKVSEADLAQSIVCGPDPQKHLDQIRQYAAAGLDYIYVHQVGPDQAGFFDFYEKQIMPRLEAVTAAESLRIGGLL